MAKTTSIEYYQTCPSCGAANNGRELCEFCGASLIKSRVQTESISQDIQEAELENELSDAEYPVIHGKSGNPSTFMILFCSVFGGVFVFVPVVLLSVFLSVGEIQPFILLISVAFLLVGIGTFIPLIKNLSNRKKCKNGRDITGVVRGYEESMMTVNGRPVLNVRLLIDEDTEPKILILNTGASRRAYPIGKTIRLKNNEDSYMIIG